MANILSLFSLPLANDGKIYINKTTDDIYTVDESADIVVGDGVFAKIYDNSKGANINVYGMESSNIKYIITDSNSSNRVFNISGELNVVEIALDETNESVNISLAKENANCNIKCLNIAKGYKNTFTQYVSHNAKYTNSNISNVGVSMDNANIMFDTTGKIEKGMSKTRCAQLSRGVVMDDTSAVTSKPILLIDEFDCFANHGASIGKMSDEDLFYLMSRGLTKNEAFLLILRGIIAPYLSEIEIDELKERIEKEVTNLIEK